MASVVPSLLTGFERGPDGIYSCPLLHDSAQAGEVATRRSSAAVQFGHHLVEVSRHHSIPVMDREVRRFLRKIPRDAVILDIGGGVIVYRVAVVSRVQNEARQG